MAFPKIRVPAKHKDYVKSFCKTLGGSTAIYVEHRPLTHQPLNQCFMVVEEQVAAQGGKACCGWRINELTGVWLEAEFHCVWQRPDGKLVDIAPLPVEPARILFVPDPKKIYRGVVVPNLYRALSSKPLVNALIAQANSLGALRKEYDLASEERRTALALALIDAEDHMRELMARVLGRA